MGIKDPTAWKDDLTFYKTEDDVAGDIEAMEPLLLHGGSKAAAGLWLALILGRHNEQIESVLREVPDALVFER